MLEKLIVTQLIKNLLAFMVPKSSLQCSQQPATGSNPKLDASKHSFLTLFP